MRSNAKLARGWGSTLTLSLIWASWLSVGLLGCGEGRQAQRRDDELLVFAAASLRDALLASEAAFEESAGVELTFNFAGSNLLALQIEAAPRADVFVSANEWWMEYLEDRDYLEPGTRRPLLSNRLAIVAHVDSNFQLGDPLELAQIPFRYLSLANPDAVPAGRYAREYLKGLPGQGGTLWQALEPRLAPAPDVRAALALVEADPEMVGIVYRTDVATSSRVRVLYEVSPSEGPAILYQIAAIKPPGRSALAHVPTARQKLAGQYLEFLGQEAAKREFEHLGFRVAFQEEAAGQLDQGN